ncbi:CRISPR-associated endonuclease Cas3'' [Mycobacterium sp. MYCO198283]|uniref:type I-G CRISPR-associated helicase/endonuclease Cas3g n=1 Tax=Mycobacterium sp. MYCO198283 TaxID=2883505 RepID=UPI001E5AEA7A|nr:CRISPR-associated endonuclease Cas3'' [Mycobacterium sp. MYCO198283]MCG5432774.1 CRISPR-associated endonuclease Cas3'' [Mycobacterium sp. MYCO198283]
MAFDEFVAAATGGEVVPYRYQVTMAQRGLPEVLRAPTGAGKTMAAVLPWLYRRTAHPDPAVRAVTPHWLTVVLPQRTLVEQTVDAVRRWIDNLKMEIPVHVLMGGEDRDDTDWKTNPGAERVFVGTQDMVLSRLLMRGFAETRAAWPMSFGLLHTGVQFIFDEVQLMGPGLPTSLQLQGLREAFGTAVPCRSMWMSATIDLGELSTVDLRRPLSVMDVTDEGGVLGRRMAATRRIERLEIDGNPKKYAALMASAVQREHCAGTRTLVVLNTVERAMNVHAQLESLTPDVDIVLLHSRFRPGDRAARTSAALAAPSQRGTIVISTQVLEAGVDVTSETLITEVAPWPSIVQRAGRCNRDGSATDARILWTVPAGANAHLPYTSADLESAATALNALEGREMTGRELAEQDVPTEQLIHPVLRRRDLLDLFDTTPDLLGNDTDVSPFIRDAEDRTVSVAWRDFGAADVPAVDRVEICQAPISDVRNIVSADSRRTRIFDQVDGVWRAARREDVRPGSVIVLDASRGGYSTARGYDSRSRSAVEPLTVPRRTPDAMTGDPLSCGFPQWVSMEDHLCATAAAARVVLRDFGSDLDLSVRQREAIVRAALLHDIGKAHPTFAASLLKANPDTPPPPSGGPWAKSPSRRPLLHDPPHFRHELAGALWLRDSSASMLDGEPEADLIVYLVAAHHGKVRVTIRGKPGERAGTTLGVEDGSRTTAFELEGRSVPAVHLSLSPTTHGAGSLTSRAIELRDRADLGPFRLAFCEAVVRTADWQASASGGM